MLPFPILNHYGNKIIQREITKFDASQNQISVLYSTGKLYSRGIYVQGNLGTGTTSNLTSWTLVQENVVDVALGAWNTVIRKNDGTIWCSGNGYMMNRGNTTNNSFVDITNLFGAYSNNIKEIQLGLYSMMFLTNDNNLYGLGYNYYGELGSSAVQSYRGPTLIATGVSKMRISSNFSGYIKNGTFYRAGYNSTTYNLGTGTNTNVTSFTPYNSVQVIDFKFDGYTTFVLASVGTNYEIHNAGFGGLGSLCTGKTTNKTTLSKLNEFTSNTSLNENSFDIIGATGGGTLVKGSSNGELFTGGYNPNNNFGIFDAPTVKNALSSNSYGVPDVDLSTCKIASVGPNATIIITPDFKVYAVSSQNSEGSVGKALGIGGTSYFTYFENYLPPA